jgi:hypothetical protein
MPSLSSILSTIPSVSEGDLITAEVANNVRAALQEIARLLGESTGAGTQKITFAPNFIPFGTLSQAIVAWNVTETAAAARVGADITTRGMMAVSLPDGARIEKITVYGRKQGSLDLLEVRVTRVTVPGNTSSTVATVPFENATITDPNSGRFSETLTLPVGSRQDASVVDNANFRYLVRAEAQSVQNLAEIHGIQFELSIGR